MTQVHKEGLGSIENALPNRAGLEVEIFGMEGIPDDVVQSHNQRVITQFSQAEADRRAASGNAVPGSSAANPAKKAKFEAPSDLKKRLAEHKAKKEAEAAAKAAEGAPIDPMGGQDPAFSQPPGYVSWGTVLISITTNYIKTGSPSAYGQPFAPPPVSGLNGFPQPQPYGQPAAPFQPPPAYGSPPGPSFGQQQQFAPPQQFQSPNNAYAPPSQYQTGPNQGPPQIGPSRAFGAASPPAPFQISPPPAQGMSQPLRSNNLPAPPGLPQRPSFGAPPVSTYQMQQMHQGQVPGPPTMAFKEQQPDHQNGTQAHFKPTNEAGQAPAQPAFVSQQPNEPKAEGQPQDVAAEKKSKKDKDKDVRLVYSDNDVSPEEKMAKLPRYAFDPKEREETVLGEITPAVTGVVSGPEDNTRDSNRGPGKDN